LQEPDIEKVERERLEQQRLDEIKERIDAALRGGRVTCYDCGRPIVNHQDDSAILHDLDGSGVARQREDERTSSLNIVAYFLFFIVLCVMSIVAPSWAEDISRIILAALAIVGFLTIMSKHQRRDR
jgi:hypothetical protein